VICSSYGYHSLSRYEQYRQLFFARTKKVNYEKVKVGISLDYRYLLTVYLLSVVKIFFRLYYFIFAGFVEYFAN